MIGRQSLSKLLAPRFTAGYRLPYTTGNVMKTRRLIDEIAALKGVSILTADEEAAVRQKLQTKQAEATKPDGFNKGT